MIYQREPGNSSSKGVLSPVSRREASSLPLPPRQIARETGEVADVGAGSQYWLSENAPIPNAISL